DGRKMAETLQQSSKKKKSLAISNLEDLIAAKGTKFLGCFRAKVFTAGQTASSRAETSNSAIKKEIIKNLEPTEPLYQEPWNFCWTLHQNGGERRVTTSLMM
ncbi:hypothetical protein ADUPG1_004963, partial [Aduncisulcus paluster]